MRNTSPSQTADFLAICVELGLSDVGETTTWAESQLVQASQPPDWMLRLSGERFRDRVDAIHVLDSIPGPRDRNLSFSMALGRLRKAKPTLTPSDSLLVWSLHDLRGQKAPPDVGHAIDELFGCFLGILDEDISQWAIVQGRYDELLALGIEDPSMEWRGSG